MGVGSAPMATRAVSTDRSDRTGPCPSAHTASNDPSTRGFKSGPGPLAVAVALDENQWTPDHTACSVREPLTATFVGSIRRPSLSSDMKAVVTGRNSIQRDSAIRVGGLLNHVRSNAAVTSPPTLTVTSRTTNCGAPYSSISDSGSSRSNRKAQDSVSLYAWRTVGTVVDDVPLAAFNPDFANPQPSLAPPHGGCIYDDVKASNSAAECVRYSILPRGLALAAYCVPLTSSDTSAADVSNCTVTPPHCTAAVASVHRDRDVAGGGTDRGGSVSRVALAIFCPRVELPRAATAVSTTARCSMNEACTVTKSLSVLCDRK
mmetsp:Transcript_22676/g.52884  ORF Transcript_22676/g.52884 Transcript_22676/m.52884 type:complete len:318 (-) Transcript_22676:1445-2398(-)